MNAYLRWIGEFGFSSKVNFGIPMKFNRSTLRNSYWEYLVSFQRSPLDIPMPNCNFWWGNSSWAILRKGATFLRNIWSSLPCRTSWNKHSKPKILRKGANFLRNIWSSLPCRTSWNKHSKPKNLRKGATFLREIWSALPCRTFLQPKSETS